MNDHLTDITRASHPTLEQYLIDVEGKDVYILRWFFLRSYTWFLTESLERVETIH